MGVYSEMQSSSMGLPPVDKWQHRRQTHVPVRPQPPAPTTPFLSSSSVVLEEILQLCYLPGQAFACGLPPSWQHFPPGIRHTIVQAGHVHVEAAMAFAAQ